MHRVRMNAFHSRALPSEITHVLVAMLHQLSLGYNSATDAESILHLSGCPFHCCTGKTNIAYQNRNRNLSSPAVYNSAVRKMAKAHENQFHMEDFRKSTNLPMPQRVPFKTRTKKRKRKIVIRLIKTPSPVWPSAKQGTLLNNNRIVMQIRRKNGTTIN